MFEPLKDIAALLQAFGIQLGDSVLKQLDNADLRWDNRPCIRAFMAGAACATQLCMSQNPATVLGQKGRRLPAVETAGCILSSVFVVLVRRWKGGKKKMLNRREQLAALQQAEAVEIRRKSDAFALRVDEFRK
jgi:hypothetical protein